MQQMLTSTPSKYDIHQSSIIESKITANPCLQKKGKKFFTPEKIMVFITYQIFYKKIFFKEIHIPLHATHFNISYNEEKILIEEVEENLIQKFSIFLLEFLVYCYLFAFLFFLVIGHRDDEFFMGFVVFCCCLLYANYNNLSYDLMQNQKQAFIFKKDLKNLLEKIQTYPTNRNKNSILSINRYNREVDSYNLSIQKIEDFLK